MEGGLEFPIKVTEIMKKTPENKLAMTKYIELINLFYIQRTS